ncbi:hypothetical protein AAF712_007705 [Marasmius tenuissimus]|uniref:F-box domain-containing protein n=1 Tax=Marasmius tenuissimus TaxID=585030 RepID=A0ABR2ZVH6_9AGAR
MAAHTVEPTLLCTQCNHTLAVPPNPEVPLELFRSSGVPSEPEIALQRQYMMSETLAFKECSEEIDRLKSAVQKLEVDRASLQIRIQERQYSISAQRRIPVEIWRRIFQETCALDGAHRRYPYHGHDQSFPPIRVVRSSERCTAIPAYISLTCSRWRDIIINFPDVWSCMWIDLACLRRPRIKALIQLILARSHRHPLTLWLDSMVNTRCAGDPDIQNVLFTMLKRSKHLCFSLTLLERIDFKGLLSFPFLQSVTLTRSHDQDNLETPIRPFSLHQITTLLSAPYLYRLHSLDLPLAINHGLLPPSSSLTSLECFEARPIVKRDLAAIAQIYPQLRELRFSTSERLDGKSFTASDTRTSPFYFPSLESLSIQSDMEDLHVLGCMTAPSLKDVSLDISVSSWEPADIGESLVGCIRNGAIRPESADWVDEWKTQPAPTSILKR